MCFYSYDSYREVETKNVFRINANFRYTSSDMNIEMQKKLIIRELKNTQDEWILKAIKKLLDIDYEEEVSEDHQQILNKRIASYEADPSQVLEWDEVKKELLNK